MKYNSSISATLDLKKSYRKNMAIGFGASGAMQIAIIVSLMLFIFQARDIVDKRPIELADTVFIVPPWISEKPYTEKIKTNQGQIPSTAADFKPVPDDEAPAEVDIPDQDELMAIAPETPIENIGDGIEIDYARVAEELIPPPDMPSFYDEPPVQVTSVVPQYPGLSQRTGIEGFVWIKAYIDKYGNVREVVAINSNAPDCGFEEAAIEAARQTVWKPAISNGMPVGVWVTYKVQFRLK